MFGFSNGVAGVHNLLADKREASCTWFGDEKDSGLLGVTSVLWVPGREGEFVAAYEDGCLRVYDKDVEPWARLVPSSVCRATPSLPACLTCLALLALPCSPGLGSHILFCLAKSCLACLARPVLTCLSILTSHNLFGFGSQSCCNIIFAIPPVGRIHNVHCYVLSVCPFAREQQPGFQVVSAPGVTNPRHLWQLDEKKVGTAATPVMLFCCPLARAAVRQQLAIVGCQGVNGE